MIFFLLVSTVAWVFHGWGDKVLHWVPQLKQFCEEPDCFGVLGVYRISFTLAAFHLLHALIMIGVTKHGDPRVSIQDGWWPLKILMFIGVLAGAFFIPNGFFQYYGWIALVASAIFILVQLLILVDFAHSWAENWIGKMEESEETAKPWFAALLSVSIFLFIISLAGTTVMYIFFAKCQMNVAFITVNIFLCLIMTGLSIHPKVQEANPSSGLLQASIISGYSTYLVWSSLNSEPASMVRDSNQCNPWASDSVTGTAATVTLIIGAAFSLLSLVYTTIRMAWSVGKTEGETQPLTQEVGEEEEAVEKKAADEDVTYSFPKFHIVFMLGAMYLAMLMTDWQTVWKDSAVSDGRSGNIQVDKGMGAVWAKIIASWLACLLYGWTLLGPALFPDREWK